MFGRLLKRFFRGRDRARPVSPPPPPIPARPADTSVVAPPPPPPVPAASSVASPGSAPVEDPMATQLAETPVQVVTEPEGSEGGRVRFVLEDGTMASPALGPDLEERLKYIVDNIVPPAEPPTT